MKRAPAPSAKPAKTLQRPRSPRAKAAETIQRRHGSPVATHAPIARPRRSAPRVSQTTLRRDASQAAPLEADVPEVVGTLAPYEAHLATAASVPDDRLLPYHADANLAAYNVGLALKALAAHEAALAKVTNGGAPAFDLDVLHGLPDLCRALSYAVSLSGVVTPRDIKKLVAEAAASRRLLLSAADTHVERGQLPRQNVDAIHKGKGKFDVADDCIALSALFTKHWSKLTGKTAITKSDLTLADTRGHALRDALRPKGAKRERGNAEAAKNRDRLWTLLNERYDDVAWRAGAFVFGRHAVDENVPPLQSRVHVKKKKTAAKGGTTPPTGSASPTAPVVATA